MEDPITSLLLAFSDPTAAVILGAGASCPHVPTTAAMPTALKRFVAYVSSYPASPLPDLPIRKLLGPVSKRVFDEQALLEEERFRHLTGDTIALALQQVIAAAHGQDLPQYQVFGLVSHSVSIVSFNWDGLAKARCSQSSVIHPHGYLNPVPLDRTELVELIDATQFADESDGKLLLGRSLVLIGEEDSTLTDSSRVAIGCQWRHAGAIVVIGYSFGLEGDFEYDRIWCEEFVAAMRTNQVPIHIVTPTAIRLREAICELVGRSVNMFAWPLSWYHLSRAMLAVARESHLESVDKLLDREHDIRIRYRRFVEG